MAVLMGPPVPRSTVFDGGARTISGPQGVQTVRVGDDTFVYVAGQDDSGISGFRVKPDGSLTNVANRADTPDLALSGVANFATASIGGETYLFANSTYENGITSFRINSDGSLSRVDVYFDFGVRELAGSTGRMSVAIVNDLPRLVVSGADDDGFSVFQIGIDGRLTHLASRTDAADPRFELNGATDTATAVVGGRSLIFVAGRDDDGITSFELRPDETLAFRDRYADTEGADASLSGVTGLATVTVGRATYVIACGPDDNGVTSLRVNASGDLALADNLTDTPSRGLAGARSLTSFKIEGESFVAVSAPGDDAVSLVHVGAGGRLTEATRVFDTGATALGGTQYNSFALVGGRPMLLATGADEDGLTAFEIGAGRDRLEGGRADDVLLGLGGQDVLAGGRGSDRLIGGLGDDRLAGGSGGDALTGGRGADALTGGTGSDDFVFNAAAESGLGALRDTITDFAKGSDDIVLRAIDANAAAGGNQAFRLDTGGAFSAGEIRQARSGSDLLIELNTDGDRAAEMSIRLNDVSGLLSANDFLL